MCVIISKPKGRKLPKAIYEESFRVNKDGAGFAYILNKEIHVEKGFFKFEEFYKAISQVENLPLLIHCRITSHGPTNENNCHPFVFKPEGGRYQFVMAHNGVLAWRSTQKASDTMCFCEDLLWPLLEEKPDFLDEPYGIIMLERTINDRNKMVIVRYDTEKNCYDTYFINKAAGNHAHGCWFSNHSWRPYVKYTGVNSGMGGLGYGYGHEDHDWRSERGYSNPTNPINNVSPDLSKLNPGEDGLYGWSKNQYGVWIHEGAGVAIICGTRVKCATNVLKTLKSTPSKGNAFSGPRQLALPTTDDKKGDPAAPAIEVPRDEDVDDEASNALKHLTKENKKIIRRFAADFLKARNIEIKGLSDIEKIRKMRTELRETYATWQVLGNEDLDMEIVKCDRDVILTVATQATLDDEEAEERETTKAQATT